PASQPGRAVVRPRPKRSGASPDPESAMVTIYWFALITGGGMLAASMFGDLFGADIDDIDTGGDGDAAKLLSLRNATYFMFGAGATGVALHAFTSLGAALVGVAATGVGVAAATAAALLLNYVKRT